MAQIEKPGEVTGGPQGFQERGVMRDDVLVVESGKPFGQAPELSPALQGSHAELQGLSVIRRGQNRLVFNEPDEQG